MTDRSMFYGAKPSVFQKAKWLRDNLTIPERILWEELRQNKLLGYRFKAQHPIDIYIADFYCHKLKLVIEIDGISHDQRDQKEYDIGRTNALEEFGIKVIRFPNDRIQLELNQVVHEINAFVIKRKQELYQSNVTPSGAGGYKLESNE
ncbi:MAG: endonuclease domain-containing protein [Cyclobacteriaceae bacterium]|nr:endonuclease domain-containing protein [Cyclobacteriaceae bacterium]